MNYKRFEYKFFFFLLFIISHFLVFSDWKMNYLFRIIEFSSIFFILCTTGNIFRHAIYLCITFLIAILYGIAINDLYSGLKLAATFVVFRFAWTASSDHLKFSKAIFWGSFFVLTLSVISIFIPIGVDPMEERKFQDNVIQFSGIMQSPNYIGFISFLAIGSWFLNRNHLFLSLISVYLGFLSGSRSFLLNLSGYIFRDLLLNKRRIVFNLTLFLFLFSIILLFWDFIYLEDLKNKTFGSRSVVFEHFFSLYYSNEIPLTGFGYGNSENIMEKYFAKNYSFHSSFLNLIIDLGIIGLVLCIILIVIVIYYEIKYINRSKGLVLQFLLYGIVTSVFDYGTSLIPVFFYFYLSALINGKYIYSRQSIP